MKKFILSLIISNFWVSGYSQTIRGNILDRSDDSKISFASVYINGTSAGTYSDQNGYFELDISAYSSMPLTVSALGYYSARLTEFRRDKSITIYLSPKIFELNEIVINSKKQSKERKDRITIFKNEFLGTTVNGKNCEILNEYDISFAFSGDTLRAFASKPILIKNFRLGYDITYYLDKFEYYEKSKSFFYQGSIMFTKDLSDDPSKKQLFLRNRKFAFPGSRMHFFRALWADDLKQSGFTVTTEGYEKLKYNKYVIQDDSLRKFLVYPEKLGVCYGGKFPSSYILLKKNKTYFDKNGYFDPLGIEWEGQMSRQRIGDLMPYEYSYK